MDNENTQREDELSEKDQNAISVNNSSGILNDSDQQVDEDELETDEDEEDEEDSEEEDYETQLVKEGWDLEVLRELVHEIYEEVYGQVRVHENKIPDIFDEIVEVYNIWRSNVYDAESYRERIGVNFEEFLEYECDLPKLIDLLDKKNLIFVWDPINRRCATPNKETDNQKEYEWVEYGEPQTREEAEECAYQTLVEEENEKNNARAVNPAKIKPLNIVPAEKIIEKDQILPGIRESILAGNSDKVERCLFRATEENIESPKIFESIKSSYIEILDLLNKREFAPGEICVCFSCLRRAYSYLVINKLVNTSLQTALLINIGSHGYDPTILGRNIMVRSLLKSFFHCAEIDKKSEFGNMVNENEIDIIIISYEFLPYELKDLIDSDPNEIYKLGVNKETKIIIMGSSFDNRENIDTPIFFLTGQESEILAAIFHLIEDDCFPE